MATSFNVIHSLWCLKTPPKNGLQVKFGYRVLRRNHFLLFSGILVDFYQTNPSQKCSPLLKRKEKKIWGTNWRLGVAFARLMVPSVCSVDCASHSGSFILSNTLPLDISIKVSINKNPCICVCERLLLVYAWVGYHLTHIQPNLSAKNLNKNCSDFTFSHLFTLTSFKSHFLFSKNFFCLRIH